MSKLTKAQRVILERMAAGDSLSVNYRNGRKFGFFPDGRPIEFLSILLRLSRAGLIEQASPHTYAEWCGPYQLTDAGRAAAQEEG